MSAESPHAVANIVELSVIMPAFNAASTIGAQLDALQEQQWDSSWEVVVADNGSTDTTAVIVSQRAAIDSRVRLVDAGDQRGAAHARNVAVAVAHGTSIAFCDADDVVGDNWVASMGTALRETPFVTGPQEYTVLNEPGLHAVYGARPALELQLFAGVFPFGPTANLGIRRKAFDRLGGFDTSIAVYEDLEFCLRAWLNGVDLQFVPDIVVHYRYRSTLRGLWNQAITYGAAGPEIARRLADAGRQTPPRWRGAKNWLWLARKLPSLRSQAGRARWVVVAGGSAGRLMGSVRSRHVML